MSNHVVEVHQLFSEYGDSYLNVLDDGGGMVGVWTVPYDRSGITDSLTYIVLTPSTAQFICFDHPDYADEWFDTNKNLIIKAYKVTTDGIEPVSIYPP